MEWKMVGPVRWKEMVFSSCMMYVSTSIECADGHQRKQHEILLKISAREPFVLLCDAPAGCMK